MREAAEGRTLGLTLLVGLVVAVAGGVAVWSQAFAGQPVTEVPLLAAADQGATCTAGARDVLFRLEQGAGAPFAWADVRFSVRDGGVDHAPVLDWGAGAGRLPTTMAPGRPLLARETTDICTAGATETWTVRVVRAGGGLVHEQAVQVR